MVIQTSEGDKIECMIRLDFPKTNNEAEYEVLVAGLDLAKATGIENVSYIATPRWKQLRLMAAMSARMKG